MSEKEEWAPNLKQVCVLLKVSDALSGTCLDLLRSLLVPEEVHNLWLKGDRTELLRRLRDSNMDKDCQYSVALICENFSLPLHLMTL